MLNENAAVARIIELMPETPVSRFRINALAKTRIAKIRERTAMTDAEILQIAVMHLLSTLEQRQPLQTDIPSEEAKSGRRPPKDAA